MLGKNPVAVDLSRARDTEAVWRLDNDTLGAGAAARRGHAFVKAEDYRCEAWCCALWHVLDCWTAWAGATAGCCSGGRCSLEACNATIP